MATIPNIDPRATNQTPSDDLYLERQIYRLFAYPEDTEKPIDLWYDKTLYGKVDKNYNAILLAENFLKQLPGSDGKLFAMNFVADAFGDLRNFLITSANSNRISSEGSILTLLNPTSAWQPVSNNYFDHITGIYQSYTTTFLDQDNQFREVMDFKDFMEYFSLFLERTARNFPLSRTGFIMSHMCSVAAAGISIKVASEDHGDDSVKFNDFIRDVNFDFYVRAARKYGFFVDKNAPWQLIADLKSDVMQQYMSRYPEIPEEPKRPGPEPELPNPREIFGQYLGEEVQVQAEEGSFVGQISEIIEDTIDPYNSSFKIEKKLRSGIDFELPNQPPDIRAFIPGSGGPRSTLRAGDAVITRQSSGFSTHSIVIYENFPQASNDFSPFGGPDINAVILAVSPGPVASNTNPFPTRNVFWQVETAPVVIDGREFVTKIDVPRQGQPNQFDQVPLERGSEYFPSISSIRDGTNNGYLIPYAPGEYVVSATGTTEDPNDPNNIRVSKSYALVSVPSIREDSLIDEFWRLLDEQIANVVRIFTPANPLRSGSAFFVENGKYVFRGPSVSEAEVGEFLKFWCEQFYRAAVIEPTEADVLDWLNENVILSVVTLASNVNWDQNRGLPISSLGVNPYPRLLELRDKLAQNTRKEDLGASRDEYDVVEAQMILTDMSRNSNVFTNIGGAVSYGQGAALSPKRFKSAREMRPWDSQGSDWQPIISFVAETVRRDRSQQTLANNIVPRAVGENASTWGPMTMLELYALKKARQEQDFIAPWRIDEGDSRGLSKIDFANRIFKAVVTSPPTPYRNNQGRVLNFSSRGDFTSIGQYALVNWFNLTNNFNDLRAELQLGPVDRLIGPVGDPSRRSEEPQARGGPPPMILDGNMENIETFDSYEETIVVPLVGSSFFLTDGRQSDFQRDRQEFYRLLQEHPSKKELWSVVKLEHDKWKREKERIENLVEEFGYLTFENLFERQYFKSYELDVSLLKKYMMDFYNSFVNLNREVVTIDTRDCISNPGTRTHRKIRNFINSKQMEEQFPDAYWVNFYARLRMLESGNDMDEKNVDNTLEEVKNLIFYDRNGVIKSLRVINEKTKKLV